MQVAVSKVRCIVRLSFTKPFYCKITFRMILIWPAIREGVITLNRP